MCGIIGYTGYRAVAPILLEGLSKLEYRGYDSAGIAVMSPSGETSVDKSRGKLSALVTSLGETLPEGTTGIGHTRWATHGGPTDENAHPHTDCRGKVAVVHNGIVENFVELRRELEEQGHVFASETDSECIPHLIESYMQEEKPLEEAARLTARRIQGAHAVVAASRRDPGKLVGFRLGNAGGIVIGYGEDEMYVASDLPALISHTRRVAYLTGGEVATTTPEGATFMTVDGVEVVKRPTTVSYDAMTAAKGEYKHFMRKEIHEQPESVVNTMGGRVSFGRQTVTLEEFPLSDAEISDINRVVLLGMGTSMHAAMVGRHWIETLARIPAESDNSSEFRYRKPILNKRTLVVSVCQSGETADTLAAMGKAAEYGARQVTLCNYEGTQATRIADGTVYIRAGLEIAVAASKTFECSLVSLYMLAMHLGIKRGVLGGERLKDMVEELAHLPEMLGGLILDETQYVDLAKRYAKYSDFLFLGRGINFPLAMEGAIKLKEISYIHAEGYPAGEMKHGPISLIDENMPVVALMPRNDLYEKMLSNVSEAKARGGKIIAVATEGDNHIATIADDVIYVPASSPPISPMLLAVPMQLLAYHIAVQRGADVDQPRNLAKSVTVE